MYEDIYESIRHAAEKRNLRERTIQLYCSDYTILSKKNPDLLTEYWFKCGKLMGILLIYPVSSRHPQPF